MKDDARCECGSRIFFEKPTRITTATGSVRDIPSVFVMECVSCFKLWYCDSDEGRKMLRPYVAGFEGEKELFRQALKSWKNNDRPETNESLIVLEEADKADFERLGL